jgi:hypothetical protein
LAIRFYLAIATPSLPRSSLQLTKMTSLSTRLQSKLASSEAGVIALGCLQYHCQLTGSYIGVLSEAIARSDGIVLPFSAQ